MELVAGRAVESAARVGADLGLDAARAQQRERAAGDSRARNVEVDVDAAAAAEMRAAGDVEEAGELGEPVALVGRGDRRELLAADRQRASWPSRASRRRLYPVP